MKKSIISSLCGLVVGGIAVKTYMDKKQQKKNTELRAKSEKHLKMFLLMDQWMENKKSGKELESYLNKYGMKRIAIYGMSYIGQRVYGELKDSSIEIAYGIDKNEKEVYSDLVLYKPTDVLPEVDAIIVCGTTGEASTMTTEEKKETIKFAIDTIAKRTKVIVGTGSNNTKIAIEMSKFAEEAGADGILVVTPYYNKTTQQGLIAHYTEIAKSVKLPIIMYSVPGRTGVNITPETCKELSKIENIVAIKEASGNISQVAKIASLCQDDLAIYSGNDDQIIPVLSLGGKGVISVLSNVMPKYTHDMTKKYFEGNVEQATKMQLDVIDLIDALFIEVNPIPVKYALNLMGYNFGKPRLPLIELSDKNKKLMEEVMKKHQLI